MIYPKHQFRYSILIAVLQVALLLWIPENVAFVSTLLWLLALTLLWVYRFEKSSLVVFFVIGLGGFCAEALVVTKGAWTYETQQFLQLPWWLISLWGTVGVSIVKFSDKVKQRYGNE